MKYISEKKINLIRIFQPLLYKTKFDWKNEIVTKIKFISENLHKTHTIFICLNESNIYLHSHFNKYILTN